MNGDYFNYTIIIVTIQDLKYNKAFPANIDCITDNYVQELVFVFII